MNRAVFYCWQSNDEKTRQTIQKNLKEAIEGIANAIDDVKTDIPIFDSDTRGVIGAVDITTTIEAKIRNCSIFVADISLVDEGKDGRKYINQNVAYELGLAVGALGWERIILIFNEESGKVEELPFDINHHRSLKFSHKKESRLKDGFVEILQEYLEKIAESQLAELGVEPIEAMLILAMFNNRIGRNQLLVISTLDDINIRLYGTNEELVIDDTFKDISPTEIIAILDDLVSRNILTSEPSSRGNNKIYSLTKEGFSIARKLTENGASMPKTTKKKSGFAIIT
jgi:hypothetical protein